MDRQREIMARLESGGGVRSVAGLANDLGVSDETIRRELRILEKQGSVVREHGGARLAAHVFEGPLMQRMEENAAAKQRIAAAAAKFVHDGMILFIDAGTTSCIIAKQLTARRSLTVITNSLQVATDLGGINGNCLFLAGGQMDYDYHAFSDHTAQEYVAGFTPHLSILSVGAIEAKRGLMDFHPGEAAMSRIAYATSERVLLGADASKFGRYGLIHTAPLSSVDILVTDAPLDDEYAGAFQHAEVVTA
ncbi:DeoR/GlpR family DNA-binding transcription regulator [Novosphingobium beihaiensis]|uniref:DeoR/GlpR family DNA-binding transcription regulator n=1 Tax=Novosphingobium beihaiensis TaxID=2930389 RepID=A0ABT0BR99_9SPHN|nr:DeoR/GlpR family DNA-binding transcription regulator [Novosphingobium beihaiensis]MCJ2187584.1 DeoR/GlpR family DNA-binding transcription regulator [Novosphingobium beihaiensis]